MAWSLKLFFKVDIILSGLYWINSVREKFTLLLLNKKYQNFDFLFLIPLLSQENKKLK